MSLASRFAVSVIALFAVGVLAAGCTASTGGAVPSDSATPGSSAEPAPTTGESVPPAPLDDDFNDVEAAWLDDGRMVAVVTWGSSSCVPTATDITADGQTVTVTLSEEYGDQICTADLAPRASLVALPAGIDPTRDIDLIVTRSDRTDDVDLDGAPALTGVPGESTDFTPSAGWFDDGYLVLLTWGSSTCPPIIDDIAVAGAAGTVTFRTEDRPCTKDMAPRLIELHLGELDDDADDDFMLTLVGDGLDATVPVIDG